MIIHMWPGTPTKSGAAIKLKTKLVKQISLSHAPSASSIYFFNLVDLFLLLKKKKTEEPLNIVYSFFHIEKINKQKILKLQNVVNVSGRRNAQRNYGILRQTSSTEIGKSHDNPHSPPVETRRRTTTKNATLCGSRERVLTMNKQQFRTIAFRE